MPVYLVDDGIDFFVFSTRALAEACVLNLNLNWEVIELGVDEYV